MGWEMLARYAGWAALIIGFVGSIWWGAHTIHNRIYNDGVTAEKARWEKREVELSAQRNAKIKAVEDAAAEAERLSSKNLAEIEARHLKEIQNHDKQKAIDVAAARAGTLKLRWGPEASGRGNSGNKETATGGTACVSNDTTRGELPRQITADLYELAADADRNTKQLAECQNVVLEDRNTPPPKPK